MAIFPQKPKTGQKVLQGLYNSVCQIIDYLPSLEVRGDNSSTSVTKTSNGTIIHSTNNNNVLSQGKQFFGWHGIDIAGNKWIACTLTGGTYISVDYYEQGHQDDDNYALDFPIINCTLSGGRDIQITPQGVINYTGEGGGGGGYQYFDGRFITISSDFTINCTLSALTQLYNLPFVESSNILMPNSLTACNNTVDFSQVGTVYPNHFIQTKDILHDGLGTTISLAWTNNPFGTPDRNYTNGVIQGLQVDLTLSGGRFADVVLHKHVVGALDPNPSIGNRYDPVDESRVDCLLTGTYDHYPHTSGFIDVVPVEQEDGKVWGVVSTNLHAGTGIAIDPSTGEISLTGGTGGNVPTPTANTILSANSQGTMQWTTNTGGTGGGIPWPNYANLDNNGGNMIMMKTRYQAGSAGGWLRISYKGTIVDDCYYVKIGPDGNNDPQIGLWRVDRYAYYNTNAEIGNTWLLPIPPDNYFYVSFPPSVASAWFDSSVSQDSPSVIPPSAINYPADIEYNYGRVYDLRSETQNYYNYIVNDAEDYYDANEYAEYAESDATEAENYATESETKNAILTGLGINSSTSKTEDTRTMATEVRNYATSARTAANAFPH